MFRTLFLHDGYDFCAAHVIHHQYKTNILGSFFLASDAGDTHPNIDIIKNDTIQAKDLRLRFKIVGKKQRLLQASNNKIIISLDNSYSIIIHLIEGLFDNQKPFFETSEMTGDDGLITTCLDWVFFSSKLSTIKLNEISNFYGVYHINITENIKFSEAKINIQKENTFLKIIYDTDDGNHQFVSPMSIIKRKDLKKMKR